LTILSDGVECEALLNHTLLARYKYEEYKTEKKSDEIYFIIDEESKKFAKTRLKTIENIILARNLATMPANDLFPESFAKIVENTKFKNTKIKIFDSKDLKKL
jgi:leucyl aminopeptidase